MRVSPLVVTLATVALVACEKQKTETVALPTTTIDRGDIAVRVQATGTVNPIDPVNIQSKAGGAIIKLPVDVGSVVKIRDTLAQIDPRTVQNDFDQAMADDVVSQTTLATSLSNQKRQDSLFARHVITASQHDSTKSDVTAAQSALVNSRANLDLARQALEDATIESPIHGTVIARTVSPGTIVTPATGQANGTTLMTIADLSNVRMQVTIDEVEMANVRVGESATVAVDAFPDRTFRGVIEKIEPQAVVTQGVTFFPVQVTIDNREGLLMPGMNGEVTIKAADLSNVVQIPIDALRSTTELAPVSRMFGISVDTLINNIRRDLVATEGTTGVSGRYVVVALPDGSYEMRLVKIGPTDLRVAQVLDGVKPGDKVVLLGAIMTTRPTVTPRLQIAASLRRGAANPATPTRQAGAPAPAQAGQATKP